jgi:hypothetical protein
VELRIKSTDLVTTIDGVPVRLWECTTRASVPVKVFIHRIAVHKSQDSIEFDRELDEQLPPRQMAAPCTNLEFPN